MRQHGKTKTQTRPEATGSEIGRSGTMRRPMRVLIADDDEDNREMYAEYLGMRGFSVGQAENDAVAVEYARRAKPDLIVMDLDMPVMDGIEAMTVLRDDAITSR